MRPKGSAIEASRPEAITRNCGRQKRCRAGTTTRSKLARYALRDRSPQAMGIFRFVPAAAAAADDLQRARVDRVVAILVHGNREHRRILDEGRFGAVAVVHVPVDDCDAPEPCTCCRWRTSSTALLNRQ
jgi:hypothetical protein